MSIYSFRAVGPVGRFRPGPPVAPWYVREESEMTAIATAGELDLADQHTLVRPEDADFGLDTTALGPEAVRRVFDTDTDELTDRIDQAWITPLCR